MRVLARHGAARGLGSLFFIFLFSGCVVVPQNRRRHLADPTMSVDPLEARARDKLHTTREAASGGNGLPAGGGCSCGN